MHEQATKEKLWREILEAGRRAAVHYGLWFTECIRQFGLDAAVQMETEAGDRNLSLLMRRLSHTLNWPEGSSVPPALDAMDLHTLESLRDAMAAHWLATDGVWFQAVEQRYTMYDAKRANDTCWASFSPLEAQRIATLLELGPTPGLKGLQTALAHRLYARINEQEIVDADPNGFTFRMNRCRVQDARRRKGLEDYPCKSGGVVEYREFARAVDPRIQVACLACPPDPHPEGWWCAWRFSLPGACSR